MHEIGFGRAWSNKTANLGASSYEKRGETTSRNRYMVVMCKIGLCFLLAQGRNILACF